jgi:hypothetical protein
VSTIATGGERAAGSVRAVTGLEDAMHSSGLISTTSAVRGAMDIVRRSALALMALAPAVVGEACAAPVDATQGEAQSQPAPTEATGSTSSAYSTGDIPLVLVLWQDVNYLGTQRQVLGDTESLAFARFDNMASAIGVHPGPGYAAYKARYGLEPTVTLYENPNFSGRSITLATGCYSNLVNLGFNDLASSVQFHEDGSNWGYIPPEYAAAPITYIPAVLHMVTYDNNGVTSGVDAVESVMDMRWIGYNDQAQYIWISAGPSPATNNDPRVRLCSDWYLGGKCVQLPPGSYELSWYGLSGQVSSIRFE